ncbi:hypothetical protein ACQPZF_06215 [Actinosynnema sp. CS-041913]|uniref:hypothetical protein n=1 Tax=Actinosynnema sp. CS-041913 TaxID=3239917 RepID=UPI003D8A0BC7
MEANHLRPPRAADAAEFVAAMRELRVRSGYSFRQLERRSARVGEVLPSSTLSSALTRSTLPREQIVTALVRACGGDEDTAAAWALVRADLAAAAVEAAEPEAVELEAAEPETAEIDAAERETQQPNPPEYAPTEPTRRSSHYRWLALAAVAAAIVLVAVLPNIPKAADQPGAAPTSTTTTTTDATTAETTTTAEAATSAGAAPVVQNPNPTAQPAPTTTAPPQQQPQPPPVGAPGDGIQRIRLGHTGLCVGEGQEKFTSAPRTVLGQHDCATASPPTGLERLPDGAFRIKLHHPEFGVGCATVDYGGTDPGVLLAGDNCGDRPEQKFTLEPLATGYRLRSVPGAAYCIGVYHGSREVGVQLIQDRCEDGPHQVFALGG